MKTGNRIRAALWILTFAGNAVLNGLPAFVPLGGVLVLYASTASLPRCVLTFRFWLVVTVPAAVGFVVPAVTPAGGLVFAVKGFVFLVLLDYLRSRISPNKIESAFGRVGLAGLGFAFTVALNSLVSVGEKVRVVWNTVRMRGGFRGNPLGGLRMFVEALLFTVLAEGEQIYLAARSKGYGDGLFDGNSDPQPGTPGAASD